MKFRLPDPIHPLTAEEAISLALAKTEPELQAQCKRLERQRQLVFVWLPCLFWGASFLQMALFPRLLGPAYASVGAALFVSLVFAGLAAITCGAAHRGGTLYEPAVPDAKGEESWARLWEASSAVASVRSAVLKSGRPLYRMDFLLMQCVLAHERERSALRTEALQAKR